MNGRGNQSSLGTAVKTAGYADGSRCPSTGRILPMAEQVRSSGRYRESGQNGLEELVISGYGWSGLTSREKMGCGAECPLMAGDRPEPYLLLIRQYPQPGVKRRQAPGTYPPGAEREGYLPQSARLRQ